METANGQDPYRPGSGLIPPYIAGRDKEIRALRKTLDSIKGRAGQMGRSPHPILVLLGPRGVGKTVLLKWAIENAGKRGIHTAEIDCELLAGTQESLVRHVFPRGFVDKALERIDSVKVQLPKVGVSAGLKDAKNPFMEGLTAFLAKEPLLLVLDEAHHCDSDSLKMLFGAVQSCMGAKLPLALILAGTPGLRPLLQRCNATYVERSKFLRINTLSDDQAKEALEKPAKEAGRPLKPGALKQLLGWSDNYPFFIQMVGTYAWDASEERAAKEISVADAKKALAEAGRDRDEFYEDRYEELKRRLLADHAIQVINIMRELGKQADTDEVEKRLMEMNEGMDNRRAMEVTGELQEVGFIWRSGGSIEPGIPSMFDHIARKRRAK